MFLPVDGVDSALTPTVVARRLDPPAEIDLTDPQAPAPVGPPPAPNRPIDRRPPRGRSTRLDVLSVVLVVAAIAWLATTDAGPVLGLGAAVLAAAFVARRDLPGREKGAAVLAAAVAASTVDYISWRSRVINWDHPLLSVPLFAAEVFAAIHIIGFHYTLWPRQEVPLSDDEDPTGRPLFILIPTVNEGTDMVEATIQGAMAARHRYLAGHPFSSVEIVVCNDGEVAGASCSPAIEDLCARLDVRCVTRKVPGGAKAGNLEYARRAVGATGDALLVVFDADQVAEPDFLLATVPNFRDASIGWVQTGQYYRNLDNPVARWANDQQAIFYRVLCPGKAAGNAAFICGTNVVVRAEALDEIGGFPTTSVTEDFAASIVLHQNWRSLFVPGVLAQGLGPLEIRSYLAQQRRWARGTLGVLRTHWRHIFLPSRTRRLDPEQRVQYALAGTHYLSGIRDLVYVVVPLAFLFGGIPAVRGANLNAFLTHFLPFWLLSQVAFWHVAWSKSTPRGVIIGFGSFPTLAGAALLGFLRGGGTFTVTAKRRVGGGALRSVTIHLICLLACGAALWVAVTRRSGAAVVISGLWVSYTALLLLAFVGLAGAEVLAARGWSLARWNPALRWGLAQRWRSSAPRLRPVGIAVVLLAVAMAAVVVPYQLRSRPAAAVVGVQGPTNPRVGLDLTSDLVARGPSGVEATLGYHVGIVGRTQEINDRFDRAWASGVVRNGGRPMVTLLFTAAGQPADLASLPSVANGVHDGDLRRWARQIRAFARPVYLSILRHVDRNWVATSAVANGGIPQDTARAWEHVRQLFSAQHANNVIWVWAPADPSLDTAYAPAAGTYDAVLLSLIEYPQTVWPDPATALAQVRRQHPTDRLLVEASLAGPEAKRLSWLRKLAVAIRKRGDISALLYHEGGPAPAATVAERASWSLGDDPTLTMAFGSAVRAAGLDSLAVAVPRPIAAPATSSTRSNAACLGPWSRWCR